MLKQQEKNQVSQPRVQTCKRSGVEISQRYPRFKPNCYFHLLTHRDGTGDCIGRNRT